LFCFNTICYGMPAYTRVVVYKGTIKARGSIFDVNDPTKLLSGTIKGYWAVREVNEGSYKGEIVDSNAVLYDSREKYYKVIPNSISTDPCDPCNIVMLSFSATDAEGSLSFYAVGKGKKAKFSNVSHATKDYVTMTLKGGGLMNNYDVFNPENTMSGPITVNLTMDTAMTRLANTEPYTVDQIINLIIDNVITARGGPWTQWDYIPAEPE
jgi:hypothetical protein